MIRLLQGGEDVVNGAFRSALDHQGCNEPFEVGSHHVLEPFLTEGREEMLLDYLPILGCGGGLAMRFGIHGEPLRQIGRHSGDGAVLSGEGHGFAALFGPLQPGCQFVRERFCEGFVLPKTLRLPLVLPVD
jgi:hypothetical protein